MEWGYVVRYGVGVCSEVWSGVCSEVWSGGMEWGYVVRYGVGYGVGVCSEGM